MSDRLFVDWLWVVLTLTAGVFLLRLFVRHSQSTLDGNIPRFRLKSMLALTTSICLLAAGATKYPVIVLVVGLPFLITVFVWLLSRLLGRSPAPRAPRSRDDVFP